MRLLPPGCDHGSAVQLVSTLATSKTVWCRKWAIEICDCQVVCSSAYLQHDVEGQQREHDQFVTVKQAAPGVVEHHICAGVKQSLQPDLHNHRKCCSAVLRT